MWDRDDDTKLFSFGRVAGRSKGAFRGHEGGERMPGSPERTSTCRSTAARHPSPPSSATGGRSRPLASCPACRRSVWRALPRCSVLPVAAIGSVALQLGPAALLSMRVVTADEGHQQIGANPNDGMEERYRLLPPALHRDYMNARIVVDLGARPAAASKAA